MLEDGCQKALIGVRYDEVPDSWTHMNVGRSEKSLLLTTSVISQDHIPRLLHLSQNSELHAIASANDTPSPRLSEATSSP